MPITTAGSYEGRAIGCSVCKIGNNGSSAVQLVMAVTLPDGSVEKIRTNRFVTEKTAESTGEELRALGWKGSSLVDLVGLDSANCALVLPATVECVVQMREYEILNKDGVAEKRIAPDIRWINSLIRLDEPCDRSELRALDAEFGSLLNNSARRKKTGAAAKDPLPLQYGNQSSQSFIGEGDYDTPF